MLLLYLQYELIYFFSGWRTSCHQSNLINGSLNSVSTIRTFNQSTPTTPNQIWTEVSFFFALTKRHSPFFSFFNALMIFSFSSKILISILSIYLSKYSFNSAKLTFWRFFFVKNFSIACMWKTPLQPLLKISIASHWSFVKH